MYPLYTAFAQAYFDQLVSYHAVGGASEADACQLLVAEAWLFGPVDLSAEFGEKEGDEVPESMR
jgi:hypothetical protein